MSYPNHVVCIATEQMATNLVPLTILNAQKIIVIRSRKAQEKQWAGFLQNVFTHVEVHFISCSEEAESIPGLFASEIEPKIQSHFGKDTPISFIWSGGTKPMSTGLYLIFQKRKSENTQHVAVYPDLPRKELQIIQHTNALTPLPLRANITMNHLLACAGYHVKPKNASFCLFNQNTIHPMKPAYAALTNMFMQYQSFRELCFRKADNDIFLTEGSLWKRIVNVVHSQYWDQTTTLYTDLALLIKQSLPNLSSDVHQAVLNIVKNAYREELIRVPVNLDKRADFTNEIWKNAQESCYQNICNRVEKLISYSRMVGNQRLQNIVQGRQLQPFLLHIKDTNNKLFSLSLEPDVVQYLQEFQNNVPPEIPIESIYNIAILPKTFHRPEHFPTHFEAIVSTLLVSWLEQYQKMGGADISEIWLNFEGRNDDIEFEWDITILLASGKLIVIDCKTFVKDQKESRAQNFNVKEVGGSFALRFEVFALFNEDIHTYWFPKKLHKKQVPGNGFIDNQQTFNHFLETLVK